MACRARQYAAASASNAETSAGPGMKYWLSITAPTTGSISSRIVPGTRYLQIKGKPDIDGVRTPDGWLTCGHSFGACFGGRFPFPGDSHGRRTLISGPKPVGKA